MESLQINDTRFAGTFANYMITRATVEMDTVDKGCIFVIDGIKKAHSIPRIDVTGFVAARNATPISKGNIVVDSTYLVPQDYMVYLEFNPRDFEQHWFSYQLAPTLLMETLPVTAESFLVFQLLKRFGEYNEYATWRGRLMYNPNSPSYTLATTKGQVANDQQYQFFDGLIYKMLNDSTTLKVPNAIAIAGATNSAGFYAFEQVYAQIVANAPALLYRYGKTGLKFHCNANTQNLYEQFLTFAAISLYKNNDATEKSINRYRGYEVEVLKGMPDNTVVLCISQPDIESSLFLGLNSTDDENELLLKRVSPLSELFGIKLLTKADTGIGYADQIAIYTTITL